MSDTGAVLFIDDEEPLRIAGQQTLELAARAGDAPPDA